MPETMLCPFRKSNTVFLPCCGAECMAYFEHDAYIPDNEKPITEWECKTVPDCKLMCRPAPI